MATADYAARFPKHAANGFFRRAEEFTMSSLGLGTYLGGMDEAADGNYVDAISAAMAGGINFIDTSLNYRHQRSERNIGTALSGFAREEFVICTKAGYLVPGAVPVGDLETVRNQHSMAPPFLKDQLARSLENLRVDAVDIFYLHNPETQLDALAEDEFYNRVARAFAQCEEMAEAGQLRYYGAATWSGFRQKTGGLSLEKMLDAARRVGGERHRFRFVQLPLNLGMCEALTNGIVFDAARLGVHVVASASLMQARLASNLPEEIGRRLPGPETDAERAIQFARSAPGVVVALAGMGRREHVEANLAVANYPPAPRAQFDSIFE